MAQVVIADASVLIALAQIGQLSLLERLYEEVVIPSAVQSEVAPSMPKLPPWVHTQTLQRPFSRLPLPKRAKTLPAVLSREEVTRLLANTTTLRERALLMTTYGGGLRVSEVVRLRVTDIDAERGMLRVEQGKGRKDRYTLLGPRLLTELRHYWQVYRPAPPWVFPQRHKAVPMDASTAQRIYYAVKQRAGITKAGGIHALRHAFATHLLEAGTDLPTLQRLLGHESVTTTMHYVHVARSHAAAQGSPLDSLPVVLPPAA